MLKYIFPWFYVRTLEREIDAQRAFYNGLVKTLETERDRYKTMFNDIISQQPKRGKNGKFVSTKK